jgi:serine/threonine protein kinase
MIGKTISHYKILEEIGSGGMGIVYKAEDTNLKRYVALKFLPPELTRDKYARERFIQEAQSASALDHPNIYTIHEIARTDDNQMFIAMSYYQGETLKDKIARGPFETNMAIDIVKQISIGLSKAHEKGIIHRDIKPANIFITTDGIIKILDFGLAKLSGQTHLTKAGDTLGTAAYMSPEQTKGEETDHQTDIWSLGVILYEMLTGSLPFGGDYQQAIIYAILNEAPKPLKKLKSDIFPEMENIITHALRKDPKDRYSAVDEIVADLEKHQKSTSKSEMSPPTFKSLILYFRKPPVIVTLFFLFLAVIIVINKLNRRSKISWAKEVAIPEIRRMIIDADRIKGLTPAFKLAEEAEKYIPEDPQLMELLSECSIITSIVTNPSGAKVYIKDYQAFDDDWNYIGMTPIDSIKLALDYFRWKLEKAGYETVYQLTTKHQITNLTDFELDEDGTLPAGMVRVNGGESEIGNLPDFLYDKYEVTNKEFKKFINDGGYRNKSLWKFPFEKDGGALTWEEAISNFVDKTGRHGPATWEAGDYPDGQDNYPVTGVSWYEAAAYAAYRQKELPSIYHWSIANGMVYPFIQLPLSLVIPLSNFAQEGPAAVGTHPGITLCGAYDIVGNVREWCYNQSQEGRCLRGGAWNDPSYMAIRITRSSPFDRSPHNGFRCAQYFEADSIPEKTFQPYIRARENDDYRKVRPVSDEIFRVYKEAFAYDKEPLKAEVEYRDNTPEDWIKEKISFNAAYNNERIFAYLYLPKDVSEPYQTIIIFPHSGATRRQSSEDLEDKEGFDFFMKDGRAVMYPIYQSTYERGRPHYRGLHGQISTRKYFELVVQLVLDFRKCMDYLETRQDIDQDKIAYYSYSWGGELISIIAAVEERLKLNILNTGGMRGFDDGGKIFPWADPINYVTRVKIPTLMLNGEFDMIYQYDKVVKPMYDLLGTAQKDKRLITYPTDHFVPRNDLITESLRWLDRYFGPVK